MEAQQPVTSPRPHVWRTGILIGLLMSGVVGAGIYVWQQQNIGALQNEQLQTRETVETLEATITQLEGEKAQAEQEKNAAEKKVEKVQAEEDEKTYRYENYMYGFGLELPAEFKGYWTNQEGGSKTRGEVFIRFFVDASGYDWPNDAFDPLVVSIYPKGWWAQHAEINEFDVAHIKGQDQTITTHLGTFIGANDRYVFTATSGVHDCPGKKNPSGLFENAEELCSLPKVATEQIFSTFKEVKIQGGNTPQ